MMKRDFVSRNERAQMDPNSCLDICVDDKTASVEVVIGVVPATTSLMPKSKRKSIM